MNRESGHRARYSFISSDAPTRLRWPPTTRTDEVQPRNPASSSRIVCSPASTRSINNGVVPTSLSSTKTLALVGLDSHSELACRQRPGRRGYSRWPWSGRDRGRRPLERHCQGLLRLRARDDNPTVCGDVAVLHDPDLVLAGCQVCDSGRRTPLLASIDEHASAGWRRTNEQSRGASGRVSACARRGRWTFILSRIGWRRPTWCCRGSTSRRRCCGIAAGPCCVGWSRSTRRLFATGCFPGRRGLRRSVLLPRRQVPRHALRPPPDSRRHQIQAPGPQSTQRPLALCATARLSVSASGTRSGVESSKVSSRRRGGSGGSGGSSHAAAKGSGAAPCRKRSRSGGSSSALNSVASSSVCHSEAGLDRVLR